MKFFWEKRRRSAYVLLVTALYLSLGLPGIHPLLHERHHEHHKPRHSTVDQQAKPNLHPAEEAHAKCPLCDYLATLQFSTISVPSVLDREPLSLPFLFVTLPEEKKKGVSIQKSRGPPV